MTNDQTAPSEWDVMAEDFPATRPAQIMGKTCAANGPLVMTPRNMIVGEYDRGLLSRSADPNDYNSKTGFYMCSNRKKPIIDPS